MSNQLPRPSTTPARSCAVALGTALVLVTYVSPIATIPTTAAALGADPVARAWILSSMSLGLASTLLAAGVLGDTLGRRRVYLAGLAALAAGAAVCATAQEPWLFVGARVVEGIGGAAVLACGLALLAHQFPPGPARVHATSVWGASVGLGIAAGAVLTALLDVGTGWRETYVVTAVAAVGLLVSGLRLCPSRGPSARAGSTSPGSCCSSRRLTLLVSALTQGRNGVDAATVDPGGARAPGAGGLRGRRGPRRRAAAGPGTAAQPPVPVGDHRLAGARRRDDRDGVVRPDARPGRLRRRALDRAPSSWSRGRAPASSRRC